MAGGFFGPGGLGGASDPASELDPQLIQALMAQFPGLQQMGQSQQQQPNALAGYQYPGTQFFQGQGSPASLGNLSPFEGAKGFGSESITAGLALGNYGKSSSQSTPPGGQQPFALGQLALPSLQLPQQVAAQQGGGTDMGPMVGGQGEPSGGITIGAGDVLGAANSVADLFGAGNLGLTTTPESTAAMNQYREQERATGAADRNLSTLGGSFLTPSTPGSFPNVQQPIQTGDMSFSMPESGSLLAPRPETTFSMSGQGSTSFAPGGGSAQDILGTGATGSTNWLGAAAGGAAALGGAYNLYGSAQGGDIGGAIGGALQTTGGVSSLLANAPALANMLGLGTDVLNAVGGATGAIGGLLSLAMGAKAGDPVQIATSLYSMLPAINALAGTAAGAATLSSLGLGALPVAATATTAATAGSGMLGAVAPILSAASIYALPVAAIVQALTDSLAEMERQRVMNAGFTNNPIKGAMYSASTAGVGNANKSLEQLMQGGGLSAASEFDLANTLSSGMNNLLPYYSTAQGGRGAIKASDTITGAGPDWAAKPYEGGQTPGQYTQNFTNANQGMAQIVNELMRRGVTYEQLGQLPGISPDWGGGSLDAGNGPGEMYLAGMGKYDAEANQLTSLARQYGEQPGAGSWVDQPSSNESGGPTQVYNTPTAFRSGLQGVAVTPEDMMNAAGSSSQIYGGDLWQALARSGAGGDQGLMSMIREKFDPWVNLRHSTSENLYNSLGNLTGGALGLHPDTSMWSAAGGGAPLAGPAQAAAPNYWNSVMDKQFAQQDPMLQQLQQYMTGLQGLQGNLGQLNTGLSQQPTTGIDPGVLAALGMGQPQQQGAPGFGSMPSGGNSGLDLQALLKQMGYA